MSPQASPQNFQKAKIREVDGSLEVPCMFNPYEYKVSKSNSYSEKSQNDADTPKMEFKSAGSQSLTLSLIFDSYEKKEDVSMKTRELWKFMETKTNRNSGRGRKVPPPEVYFEWGVFQFRAVITQMTQTFTMFSGDGKRLAADDGNQFVHVWDVDSGQLVQSIRTHAGNHQGIALDATGARVAVGVWMGPTRVFDVQTGEPLLELAPDAGRGRAGGGAQ